jgi:hypothetical protein
MSDSSITVRGALALVLGLAGLPSACSGDSTSSGEGGGRGGSTAEAGAPGAGTAGSSGGSGGTGGTAPGGKGGSAGKAGVGGSAGTAGSATTGGTSGDGGAGDGAGSPGTGATGGDLSTGGDPSTGGMAGAGAMTGYHPPGEQIDACTSMCEREAEANCPNEGTAQECFDGCRVGIQFEPCSSVWDALFECAETADTVTCTAEGEATVPDCVTQYAEVIDCVFNENLDESYTGTCDAYCGVLEAAACENAEPAATCASTCVILGSAFPVCTAVYSDFLECSTDADITCDAEGKPTAEDCASEYVLFLSCLVNEYDWEL